MGVGIFLFVGFVRFSIVVAQYNGSVTPEADAIVVLTGGKSRIETGLYLLGAKRGKRMLISGVHRDTGIEAISARYSENTKLFSCCIDIDRLAMNTAQNGRQTAKWAKSLGIRSLIVVTSDYHMPRSLFEMSRSMPDVLLIPYAAGGENSTTRAVVGDPDHIRNVIIEYFKIMAASVNLGEKVFLRQSRSSDQYFVANDNIIRSY